MRPNSQPLERVYMPNQTEPQNGSAHLDMKIENTTPHGTAAPRSPSAPTAAACSRRAAPSAAASPSAPAAASAAAAGGAAALAADVTPSRSVPVA